MIDLVLYVLVALGSLAIAGLLLFALSRFFLWLDWMELPKWHRDALKEYDKAERQAKRRQAQSSQDLHQLDSQ